MKRNLLILAIMLLSLSAAATEPPVIYNSIGYRYTPFIQFVCMELEITTDIYVLYTDKMVGGFVIRNGLGGYIIFVSNRADRFKKYEVLAHELCHIRDDIQGVWSLDKPTTVVGFYGNKFTSPKAKEVEKRVKAEGRALAKKYRKIVNKLFNK